MTDQPTPTPRTEAAWQSVTVSAPWDAAAEQMAQHARELERELRFNEKVSKQIWSANERLQAELVAERALADRLAETLANVQGDYASTGGITTPEVDEALSAWKSARNEAVNPP